MQSVPLVSRIAAIARRQHGLVTRAQLVELGLGRSQIAGWTASGRLDRVVVPGVLRLAGAPVTRDQSFCAAALWGGTSALVSHEAAGEVWGYDGVRAREPAILVPASRVRRCAGITVHHTRTPLTDRRTRRGLPVTTPERTLIDLAGVLRPEPLEVAFESARRERHVTIASVERALHRLGARGRAGTEQLQALLRALAHEPPAESALEVMTARVLRVSRLPRPQRQVEVHALGATYRLDFAWPGEHVALECDGKKWHQGEGDFERDRQRWSAITAATGYRIVWATWARVTEQPDRLVDELRHALAGGSRRNAAAG